jgi:hypothetical protein
LKQVEGRQDTWGNVKDDANRQNKVPAAELGLPKPSAIDATRLRGTALTVAVLIVFFFLAFVLPTLLRLVLPGALLPGLTAVLALSGLAVRFPFLLHIVTH